MFLSLKFYIAYSHIVARFHSEFILIFYFNSSKTNKWINSNFHLRWIGDVFLFLYLCGFRVCNKFKYSSCYHLNHESCDYSAVGISFLLATWTKHLFEEMTKIYRNWLSCFSIQISTIVHFQVEKTSNSKEIKIVLKKLFFG